MKRPVFSYLSLAVTVLACAVLSGCGGGLVAGVGSGGSGVAEGTLSGFGSVIVDGIEYSELALTEAERSTLRLGQRVRLVFDGNNVAQSIEVLPQLRGPITASLDDSGWLRLAGQWVRVVDNNDDSSRSGITLVDGFADADTSAPVIPAGDDAVVYGSWVWDNSKAAYVLVATRIEKLAVAADPVLLGGVAVAVGSNDFRLGSAAGTQVSAARLPALTEGSIVALLTSRTNVMADRATAQYQGLVASVTAQDVRDASLSASDLSSYKSLRLGGLANAYDAANATVTIQGTPLRLDSSATQLAIGQFVRANAETITADASALQRIRSPIGQAGDDGTGSVTELKGLLSGVNWSAASVSFTLRGVPVQADAAQISASCRNSASTQTLYVVVAGYAPAPTAPLRANAVTCTSDLTAANDV